MKIVQKPGVDGLPKGHRVEYFGKIDETTFFVIHCPKENWDDDSFQAKVGSADHMHEVKVKKVTRYRHSGATNIKTDKGNFYFPSRLIYFKPNPLSHF